MAAVEHVAEEVLLADVHLGERHLYLADDAHGAGGAVDDLTERVDRRDLEGELGTPDSGQIGS